MRRFMIAVLIFALTLMVCSDKLPAYLRKLRLQDEGLYPLEEAAPDAGGSLRTDTEQLIAAYAQQQEWDGMILRYAADPDSMFPEYRFHAQAKERMFSEEDDADTINTVFTDILFSDPYAFVLLRRNHASFSYRYEFLSAWTPMPQYVLSDAEFEAALPEYSAAWQSFLADVRAQAAGKRTLDTALITAQAICERCTYDNSRENRSAYDGVMKGATVCMGYTNWFNAAMHEMGYTVTFVSSPNLQHVWSAVYVPELGRWAEIDVTWMDHMNEPDRRYSALDLAYFDFSSRDSAVLPEHFCTDQESMIGLLEEPVPAMYAADCFGLRAAESDDRFIERAVPLPGGGFSGRSVCTDEFVDFFLS